MCPWGKLLSDIASKKYSVSSEQLICPRGWLLEQRVRAGLVACPVLLRGALCDVRIGFI